ncbi:phosphoribosylanthranilate isomerase [Pyrococcus furiosus DSM 3638]|uniref:N-(5'-phosphoribosyl)anthranilate isomerase n=4 Tax=Pyrococcus furiosus TaxID=2261 RepID=TRPF_PYRFU|nr:phosphoribosylanthranilate isomerase [Pyrococcus furiosus]Q8U092.1 RecName: Full=N-(5'-phosphoribosyl)anthranilate isomerase; Short=PRAI [Pyrococcus furiosus DSM 3638]AAL81831.1 phosphoribosyl anthranilate isomerase [Pyrococcus furiosus DSM 3638]AFN04933.1 N-(5'-phosphoribosyl)anthranilate isomerase [Pyrococcus furiosus COM1]QEK79324.1 phosphoribosylanthranilate isomerase [Pyrococcus furiosus DSM 3638]
MFVKICGIKSLEELEIVEKHADATGVVVNSNSKRRIPLEKAREIIENSAIPVFLVSTMVGFSEWAMAIERTGAQYIQVHSNALPQTIDTLKKEFGVFVMKAFRVPTISKNPEEDANRLLSEISRYNADMVLLDTGAGSGKLHDLRVSSLVARKIPVIVAGGLNAENVEEVIKVVKPYGVDVSSGVEKYGIKDPKLVEEFVRRAKNVVW